MGRYKASKVGPLLVCGSLLCKMFRKLSSPPVLFVLIVFASCILVTIRMLCSDQTNITNLREFRKFLLCCWFLCFVWMVTSSPGFFLIYILRYSFRPFIFVFILE